MDFMNDFDAYLKEKLNQNSITFSEQVFESVMLTFIFCHLVDHLGGEQMMRLCWRSDALPSKEKHCVFKLETRVEGENTTPKRSVSVNLTLQKVVHNT